MKSFTFRFFFPKNLSLTNLSNESGSLSPSMSSENRKSKPKVSPSKTLHDFDGRGMRHTSPAHLLRPALHSAVVRSEIDGGYSIDSRLHHVHPIQTP